MAHQLIGFYTVADNSDGILKVMRSYQYYAANAISDRVSKVDWYDKNTLGGYVWHTTGERVIIVMGALNVILSRVSRTLTKYYSYIA